MILLLCNNLVKVLECSGLEKSAWVSMIKFLVFMWLPNGFEFLVVVSKDKSWLSRFWLLSSTPDFALTHVTSEIVKLQALPTHTDLTSQKDTYDKYLRKLLYWKTFRALLPLPTTSTCLIPNHTQCASANSTAMSHIISQLYHNVNVKQLCV